MIYLTKILTKILTKKIEKNNISPPLNITTLFGRKEKKKENYLSETKKSLPKSLPKKLKKQYKSAIKHNDTVWKKIKEKRKLP